MTTVRLSAELRFWLRILWVVIQLMLAFWFGWRGSFFYYQAF